eukprot:COSAG04_NODE_28_length_36566_cov_70.886665_21_plen_283_part_00
MPRQQPLLLPSFIVPLLLALAYLLLGAAFAAAGKPPPKPQGIAFFAGFSDHAVLQRGPGRAAVYGSLGPGGTGATVQLSSSGGAAEGSSEEPELVEATATPDGRWKALLPAHPAGGDYTLTATCHGCTAEPKTAALRHVVRPLPTFPMAAPLCAEGRVVLPALQTFGDVVYCSGQSNMWLPLLHTLTRNDTLASLAAGKYANIRSAKPPVSVGADQMTWHLWCLTACRCRGRLMAGDSQQGNTHPWKTAVRMHPAPQPTPPDPLYCRRPACSLDAFKDDCQA